GQPAHRLGIRLARVLRDSQNRAQPLSRHAGPRNARIELHQRFGTSGMAHSDLSTGLEGGPRRRTSQRERRRDTSIRPGCELQAQRIDRAPGAARTGVGMFYAMPCGGPVWAGVNFYLFGQGAAQAVERNRPLWRAWMDRNFPAASAANDSPAATTSAGAD